MCVCVCKTLFSTDSIPLENSDLFMSKLPERPYFSQTYRERVSLIFDVISAVSNSTIHNQRSHRKLHQQNPIKSKLNSTKKIAIQGPLLRSAAP
jgi:hypothetical protein